MKANRVVRVIIGLLVLAIFLAYFQIRASYSPMSGDITGPNWEEYLRINFNMRPDGSLIEEEPAPAQEAEPAPAAEAAPVVEAQPAEPAEPAPAPTPTVDPASPYGQALANAAARGLPEPPELDVNSWELMLVNADHSIDQYEPAELAYLNQTVDETDIQYAYNGYRCPVDSRIAENLLNMALACKNAGLPVYLSSGYRSYNEQAANFQRVCQNNGITDGKNAEGHYITMPAGCSEHQSGLCCDITDHYREIKNDSIAETATVQWLAQNCADYGFVLRFPVDKREITHVMGESWHFRYVGEAAAAYMTANNLCLEEFLGLYGVV